jgi:hypothetical protein
MDYIMAKPGLFVAIERLVSWQTSWQGRSLPPTAQPPGSQARMAAGTTMERPDAQDVVDGAFADAIIGQEVSVKWLYLLAVATKLNLGEDDSGGQLAVEVPYGYTPSTSKTEMISTFLGAWAGCLHPDSAAWASKVIDRGTRAQLPSGTLTGPMDWLEDVWSSATSLGENAFLGHGLGDSIPGLFWTEDYLNGALVMAVQTAHAFAPMLGLMAPEAAAAGGYRSGALVRESISFEPNAVTGVQKRILIRDAPYIAPQVGSIKIDDDGFVELFSPGDKYAFAFLDAVWLFQPCRDIAAIADYMFWWAHRLHSMALETNESRYKDVGLLAAKCGLAQIVQLASLIVHEFGHLAGELSAYHCTHDEACNQYIAQYTFQHAVRALLGVPDGQSGKRAFSGDSLHATHLRKPPDCNGSEFVAEHDGTSSGHASSGRPIYLGSHDLALEVTISVACGGTGVPFAIQESPSGLEAWLTKEI